MRSWWVVGLVACSEYGVSSKDVVEAPDSGTPPVVVLSRQLEVRPPEVDFGQVAVGTVAEATLQVVNVGEGPVAVSEVGLVDPDRQFEITAPPPGTLEAGGVWDVPARFRPTARGDWAATVFVTSDAESPDQDAARLRGGTTEPGIYVDPSFQDLGVVEVGTTVYGAITIGNSGSGPVTVNELPWFSTSPELSIPDWGPFATLPVALAGGDRVVLEVRYTPTDEAGDEATLRVLSDDPAHPELAAQIGATGCVEWSGTPERTPWQMHQGEGVQLFGRSMPSHGHPDEYAFSTIPPEGDPGWTLAPDPAIVAYSVYSTLCGVAACREGGEFTYFQTLVTIPAGLDVDTFTIDFTGIDDGVRVTVFNSAHPAGYVEPGSYVYLGGSGTTNLADIVVPGEVNRVVVTHVDDCCTNSGLASAQVTLEGEVVVECP